MLQEEKMEEKRKKDKEEIQKRFADVECRQAEEREADRERKRERARRAKRRGPRLLGRGSILGALSRSLSFNVRISYSIRHVRSRWNTTLACFMYMPVQLFM